MNRRITLLTILTVGTVTAALAIEKKLLPSAYTYEIVFCPAFLVGLSVYFSQIKSNVKYGKVAMVLSIASAPVMVGIANLVDFQFIYLDVWHFVQDKYGLSVPVWGLYDRSGNPIVIPVAEILMFNLAICYIGYFLIDTWNAFIKKCSNYGAFQKDDGRNLNTKKAGLEVVFRPALNDDQTE